ncbi:MAG: hypothetical protein J6Q79_08460 [Clostridia bacterium]|nr:hypothetical protein [Clostridia bacterium]
MKKIISLLLALIMTFSVATVAFAEDAAAPEEPAENESVVGSIEEALGDYAWILDLPFETVGPALKIAKIALKFLKVYWKLCEVFHLDPMETAKGIIEFITDLADKEQAPETEVEGTAPEATPAIA